MSGQGPSVALDTQESDQLSDRVERLFLQHPCADFVGKELVSRRDAGLSDLFQLVLQALPSVIREGLVVDFHYLRQAPVACPRASIILIFCCRCPQACLSSASACSLLIGGISLCTLSCFLTAYSRDLFWVEVARILMGLGSAPTFVCTATLATRWFPPTMLSILIASGCGSSPGRATRAG